MRLHNWVCLGAMIGCAGMGCNKAPSPGTTYEVYISSSFTEKNAEIILQAFSDWEGASQGGVHFNPWIRDMECDDNCGYVITVNPASPKLIQNICDDPKAIDCTQRWIAAPGVWSNIELTPEVDPRTIRHEIGHALGLSHDANGTIMCYSLACAATIITCEDVAQYYSLRPWLVAPECSITGKE